jgi:hypothetical protein
MKDIQPLAVSISDAVRLSGIGRTSLYIAIQRGALKVKKCGRRTLVPVASIRELLDSLPTSEGQNAA